MRLAFSLFNYFPYGGLQRDFIRIARACRALGHSVDVFTMSWEGEAEPGLTLHLLPAKGMQNHSRRRHFADQFQKALEVDDFDLVVGFNKMPGLDVYYAADTCYQAKARQNRGLLYRLSGRYRATVAFEKAVFAAKNPTKILLISPQQQQEFMRYYQTPAERFHLLPPGIDKNRMAPPNIEALRAAKRAELNLSEKHFLLLMVGSGFRTKGLDRVLHAFVDLPFNMQRMSRLIVIGRDNIQPYLRVAKKLNLGDKIEFLGGRDDVVSFYQAADLLLHPAYNENTGTVILEALASGLPVVATDVCGYAHYIEKAGAGAVLPAPFNQKHFSQTVAEFFPKTARSSLRKKAIAFAQQADIYSMPERAAAIIDSYGDL